jgi:hypothetical protein
MSVQTNHRVEREVAAPSVVPGWAEEDWEVTIDRFLGSVDDLPADVEKAYRMLSGPPERGTLVAVEIVSVNCDVGSTRAWDVKKLRGRLGRDLSCSLQS